MHGSRSTASGRRWAAALAVATLTACGGSNGTAAALGTFSRTDDPRVIVVRYTTGKCDTIHDPTVTETATTVTVEVLVDTADADTYCGTIADITHEVRITLMDALGSRTIRGRPQDPDLQQVPLTPAP